MEKGDKKCRQSNGVLGQMYRSVKSTEEAAVAAFIRQDYEKSIL